MCNKYGKQFCYDKQFGFVIWSTEKKSSINLRVFNFIAEEINPIFTNCVIKKYQCFKQVYIILKRHV